MLLIISPAKTLDFDTPAVSEVASQPRMLNEAQALVSILRTYSESDLANLMKLSPKLALLNAQRYAAWSPPFSSNNAKQAVLAMKGDVYSGLDAESFTPDDFAYAQQHLRILSGLYGVLRPMDLMQAYRLEMGTRLPNDQGSNLYAFWGEQITDLLNQDLAAQDDDVLLNLASNEYFKAVKPKQIKGRIIDLQFKERKDDGYRTIGLFAKKARGLMSRYIIRNRLQQPEQIKSFSDEGYCYNPTLSSADEWVFSR